MNAHVDAVDPHAVRIGAADVARILVSNGAKMAAVDHEGNDALLLAVRAGAASCVRVVLDTNARSDVRKEQMWPLANEEIRALFSEYDIRANSLVNCTAEPEIEVAGVCDSAEANVRNLAGFLAEAVVAEVP